MSFVSVLETIGKGFAKGLKWAVEYAVPHHWASLPTAAVHLSNGLLPWKTSSECVAHRKQGFLRVRATSLWNLS